MYNDEQLKTPNLQTNNHEEIDNLPGKQTLTPGSKYSKFYLPTRRSSSPLSLTMTRKRQRQVSPNGIQSIGPSNGTVEDTQRQNYQTIATITEQQNKNLKEQNKFLLEKIKKMQEKDKKMKETLEKTKKYKELYLKAKLELQIAQEQCQANKQTAEDMKKIAELGILHIKQKIVNYYDQESQQSSNSYDVENSHQEPNQQIDIDIQ